MTATLLVGGQVWGSGRADLLVQNNRILDIGDSLQAPESAEKIDISGCVAYPGLVNTHHHLAQSLMKGIPAGINQTLGDWLGSVPYKCWPHFTPDMMYTAARVGLIELLRSGSTTCADHHYLYHQGTSPEMEDVIFQAAKELGIRIVLCRGGSTTAGSRRGTQMASSEFMLETVDLAIRRMEDTMARHHDDSEASMSRLVVAPTSLIHASTKDDLLQLAEFARANNLRMHSHLLEVIDDEIACQQREGKSAIDYAREVGWLGEDVWFAHMVHADDHAVKLLGDSKTGIAHCPTSNSRLGSGIAPIPRLKRAGARISIGVDGSASAESGSAVNELMTSWLIHRTLNGPESTDVEESVRWATSGGAEVLGFPTLGKLETGMLADIAIFDLNSTRFAGLWEPVWAPVICGEPQSVKHLMVDGKWSIRDYQIAAVDEEQLMRDARDCLHRLKTRY